MKFDSIENQNLKLVEKRREQKIKARRYKTLSIIKVLKETRAIVLSGVVASVIGIYVFGYLLTLSAATKTWDGGGADNNWSTCANWNLDTCPAASDTVVFDGTSSKNVTVDAGFAGSILNVNINATYGGTITLARSFTASSSFTQSGGTFNGSNQAIAIGTFNFSGGTFTSTSGTFTSNSNFTISGSAVFNHNNGTVAFGSTGNTSVNCNNATFNLVTISRGSGTFSVTNCNLPLGNNPTANAGSASYIQLYSSVLSGTGTLSTNSYIGLNTASSLSGFTGLSAYGLTFSSSTMDFSSYSPFTLLGGSVSLTSSSNLTFPNTTLSVSDLTVTNSTFKTTSGILTITGSLNFSGTSNFDANGGTIAFTGTSNNSATCNNATFNLVSINRTNGTFSVTNCNFPLGNNPTATNGSGNYLQLYNSILTGTGTLTTNNSYLSFNNGSTISGFTGLSTNGLVFNASTMDFSSYSPFVLGGGLVSVTASSNLTFPNTTLSVSDLTVTNSTFKTTSGTLTITGSLNFSGTSNFDANGGTIAFTGTSNNSATCNNATFNLVSINRTNSTFSVTNCNFPLGNNPTATNGSGNYIQLYNSVFTGSGTLTMNNSYLGLNSGSSISGFTGLSAQGLTFSASTMDFSSYSPFTLLGGSVSLTSSSNLTFPNTTLSVSDLTVTNSTFKTTSGILTITGSLNFSGTSNFDANGGTIAFTGTSNNSATCNNATFNAVTIARTNGSLTLNNCNFPLGNNPTATLGGGYYLVLNNSTLAGSGTLNLSTSFLNLATGGVLSGFTGLTAGGLAVSGATANFSTYSPLTINGDTAISSGSITLPATASTNTLTISGGTFNAPSGNYTVSSTLNVTGSPTFNANGGTVTFSGGIVNLTCNNITFNLVSFTGQTGTKTVASSCNLPLGNNPVIPNSITLNGTLTGTGTLTMSTGTLLLNSTAALSGFNGMALNALTVAGATVNFNTYSSFTVAGAVNLSSGSLTLTPGTNLNSTLNVSGGTFGAVSGDVSVASTFTLSGGTFNAPTGTLNLGGALTVSNTPTFNHNSGTINVTGSGVTLACGNLTFNRFTFNNTGSITVNNTCNLPLGNNPTVANSVSLSGVFNGTGTFTMNAGTLTLNTASGLSGFSAAALSTFTLTGAIGSVNLGSYSSFTATGDVTVQSNSGLTLPAGASITGNLTMTGTGSTFTGGAGNLTVGGTVTVNTGIFTAPSGVLYIGGNFTHTSGTFTHNSGTVNFNGSSATQTISGIATTFNNLTKTLTAASGQTLQFPSAVTTTVVGAWTVNGYDTSARLSLRSTTNGSQWRIDPQGTRNILYLDVKDGNNISATPVQMGGTGSIDSTNNTNFNFGSLTPNDPSNLGPANVISAVTALTLQPTFQFTLSDPNTLDTIKYQIQISTVSDFSSTVVDYTSALLSQGTRSFTVGQNPSTGVYAVGAQNQTLTTNAYYWRVRATDNNGLVSNYVSGNSGNIAFYIDSDAPAAFTPTLNVTSPTNNQTPTLTFSTTDNVAVDHYQVKIDSGSYSTRTSPYVLPTLTNGTHTIYVRAFDTTGNITNGDPITITVDTSTPVAFTPTLDVTSPTNNTTPTVSFSTTDNDGISHYSVKVDSGSFSIQTSPYQLPALSEGNHTITVRAFDVSNNYTDGTVNVTIDTTAPNAFTPTLNVTSPTSNTTPTLSFTTSDAHGISHYEVQIDGGAFSTHSSPYILPTLTNGDHTIVVRAYDNAGNYTDGSVSVTVDTSGPATFTPTLDVTSPTNNQTPTLTFSTTAPAGIDYYEVQIDGGLFTTQTSPYVLPALSAGSHTITVRAYDLNANYTDGSVNVTIDITPPNAFTPVFTAGSLTNDSTPRLTFNTSDTSGIDHYEVQIDGGVFSTHTSPYDLPSQVDGTHTVIVRAYDNAGNYRDSNTASITIDTELPAVFTPTLDVTSPTTNSTPVVTFSTTDNIAINYYQVKVDGGLFTTRVSPYQLPTLSNGNHTITVRAYDTANNFRDASVNVTVDISAPDAFTPTLNVTSPTNNQTPTLSFSTTDDVGIDRYEVKIDSGSFSVQSSPYVLPTLASGAHTITVRAYNLTNSYTDGTVNVTIDLQAPTINPTIPTTVRNVDITDTTINVHDVNGVLIANVNGTGGILNCIQQSSININCTVRIFESGTFHLNATDNAGNLASQDIATYVIEDVPPTITITAPTKGSNSTITDTTVQVTDNYLINKDDVVAVSGGTLNCTQTNSTTVDCTATISASGDLVVNANDVATNAATKTESGYVINTTPPAAFTPTLNTPNLTTNNAPILFFLSTDSDGIDRYEVKIDSGNFTVEVSPYQLPTLADGTHTFLVRAFDTLGNYTDGTKSVTIDTTAPAAFTPTLNVTSPTTNTTPTVSFSTTDASGINHYEVKVDNGSFTSRNSPYLLPTLSSGEHTITVRAFDNVGLYTDGFVTVTVDGTAPVAFTPTLNVTSPTNNQTPTLTFGTTDNDGINHYEVQIDSGSFSTHSSPYQLPTLSEGDHTITIKAVDNAGNSTNGSVNVTIDITAPASFTPTLNVTSPTNNQTPTLTFGTTDNIAISHYEVEVDGGGFSSQISPYTLDTLAEGDHTISVKAFDTAGNSTVESILLSVVLNGPAAFTPTLNETSPTNNQTPMLSFETTANSGINRYEVQIDSGSFSTQTSPYQLPILSQGEHTFTVRAFDNAGNSTDGSTSIVIDITSPLDFEIIVNSPTNNQTPEITFSTTDNLGVDHYEVQIDSSAFTTQTSPYQLPIQNEGSHSITVVAFDAAGNSKLASTSVIIDLTSPVIIFTAPTLMSNSNITDTTIHITDDVAVNLSGVSATGGTLNCTQTNATTVDCTSVITQSGDLQIDITDAAGNNSTTTVTGYYIDATAPVITITAPIKTSNTTITDTTINITDNFAINAANVNVSGGVVNCTQTDITTVDCTVSISLSGNLVVTATDTLGNQSTKTESGYVINNVTSIPSPFIPTLNTGSYTSNRSPILSFFTTDEDGINRYEVKIDNGNFAIQTSPYQLPELAEGFHTFVVRAYSNNGNYRDGSVSVTIDLTSPVDINLSLDVESPTNNQRPVVYFNASDENGIDHYEVKVASSGGVFIRASSPYQVPLLDEEEHTITVRAFDKAFNMTEVSADLLVDITSPIGVFIINDDQKETTEKKVLLAMNAEDNLSGIYQMIISENSDFNGATYEPYATSKEWYLSNDGGEKTIYVKFKDKAGNESEVYKDSIIYIDNSVITPVSQPDNNNADNVTFPQAIINTITNVAKDIPAGLAVVATVGIAANVASYPNIISYGLFIIRYRKKKKTWGIVYNSNSYEPIAFASVKLFNADTKEFITERITDIDGKYGFVVDKGKYLIEVKQSDYESFQKSFEYSTEEGLVVSDIALKPIVATTKRFKLNIKSKLILLNTILVYIGLVLSVVAIIVQVTVLNVVVIALYIVQFAIYLAIRKPTRREWGYIYNSKTGDRIKGAFVRVYSANVSRQVEVVITDVNGRYSFNNLKDGDYVISVYCEGYKFPSANAKDNIVKAPSGQVFIKAKVQNGSKINLAIPLDPEKS